jgi:hypothetical protein
MGRFSKRHRQPVDAYRYDIDHDTRFRLLQCLSMDLRYDRVLHEMHDKVMLECGGFEAPGYRISRTRKNPVEEHFFSCNDEEVMDFLVWCFETCVGMHPNGEKAVNTINRILAEEGIGYELTPYVLQIDKTPSRDGKGVSGVSLVLPRAIRKDEATLHVEVLQPCLAVLADKRFETANKHLFDAFEELRHAKYDDAMADAGAAFESVLKVICTENKWPYAKDKDTLSRLLDVCRDNGLFPGFYRPILECVGSVRNKLAAHGGEPTPSFVPSKAMADHMIYMVCNNINFVIAQSKL